MKIFRMDGYLKKLEKALKTERETKKKIIADIRSDFEMYLADGYTVKQVIEKMGSPHELANEFNENCSGHLSAVRRRRAGACAVICGVVSAACFAAGLAGRYICRSEGAHIGGADMPTEIQIISEPFSAVMMSDILIAVAVFSAVSALICAGYVFMCSVKNRY